MRQGLPLQKEVRDQPWQQRSGEVENGSACGEDVGSAGSGASPQRGRTALANALVILKILPVKSWDRDMARGWRQGQSDWKR